MLNAAAPAGARPPARCRSRSRPLPARIIAPAARLQRLRHTTHNIARPRAHPPRARRPYAARPPARSRSRIIAGRSQTPKTQTHNTQQDPLYV